MFLDFEKKEDIKKGFDYLNKLIENKSKTILKKIIPKRTIKLNAYLHVCITLYAIEFGYTLYESKIYLKRMCGFMVYEKNDTLFLKETSKLNNSDCSKFVEWIRNFSSQNGCYIPTPEEYRKNKFNIDKEINKHKEFL